MAGHILIARGVIPKQVVRKFYQTLLKHSAQELSLAVEWLQSETVTLSLPDCANSLAKFAEKRGTSIAEAGEILEALFSLEGLRSALGWSSLEINGFLSDDAKEGKLVASESEQAHVQEIGRAH